MGTLDSKNGNYVGLLAAVLFMITAFLALLMKTETEGVLSSTSQYLLMASGVIALIAGILIAMKPVPFAQKADGVMLVIFGIVAAIAYVLINFASMDCPTVIGIVGALAFVTMLAGCAASKAKNQAVVMYLDIILAIIEIILVALIFTKTALNVAEAASFMVAGFWLACHLVMDMNAEPEAAQIDPSRKSAKRAKKQQSKQQKEKDKKIEHKEKIDDVQKDKKHEHKEPEKPAPAAEEPKAEEPKAEPEAKKKPNNDFMSKLVSSKDASSKAAGASVSEPAPVVTEPVAEEPAPVEEPKAEPEPVEKEKSFEDALAEFESSNNEEPDMEDSGEDFDDEDTFTDYSPEALVRRAAWNKGLRCRRDYGDFHVPVAFVKGKVAVYVEEPGHEDRAAQAKLEEDGWVVLRFDINKVTDGLDEGAQIAEAVKANTRAMKAAKKKKKPAKK